MTTTERIYATVDQQFNGINDIEDIKVHIGNDMEVIHIVFPKKIQYREW